jgi:hypothetical protein
MSQDIYQPSLEQGEDYQTRTYDINRLWYVAFLGGLVPTMILAARNAGWLRVDRKIINLVTGLGAAMLLVKLLQRE